MSRGKGKALSEEDRILWETIARSVTPAPKPKRLAIAKPVASTPVASPEAEKPKKSKEVATAPPAPAVQPPRPAPRLHLDAQTVGKLAKGRLQLEARVDLHGMRQDEAYSLLLSFVARAHARGVRYVLVITGKGSSSGGDGVLKRSVPGWLSTAPFRPYVSAHESAARGHGGSGALYVRLKRIRNP
ncbi:MAG: Smr/MutS family protein [Rhizobiaceae bacterium]|nr:Smr/MutS family protein [Rhizobiaceae bacterium]